MNVDEYLLASFAILFLALAVHPFATYPLSLMMLRKKNSGAAAVQADDEMVGAPVSICVCAYNEEAVIRRKAENLLAIKRSTPNVELLVYVDASTDATADILRAFEPEITVVVGPKRQGKTYGMERLIARATGDIIVFSDANVMFAPDAVAALRRHFADPEVGCVCGTLSYTNGEASATAAVGSAYWRHEEWVKQLESDTGSVLCADGSIFAVRRALYPAVPSDIIDDFYVSLSILCDGYRIVRAPDALAWEQSTTASGDEFRRKVRIACQAFNVHRLLWPRVVQRGAFTVYKYVSHKLLRWLGAFSLAASGGFAFAFLVTVFGWEAALLTTLGGVTALALGHALRVGPVRRVTEILSAFAATALGVVKSFRGERFQTWTPAGSVRVDALMGEPSFAGYLGWGSLSAPPMDAAAVRAIRPIHASRMKRVLDVVGAAGLLVLFAPLMLAVAVLVRRDGGPILFAHRRIGVGGRRFGCLKFRTMHVDAERMLEELLASDADARDEWERTFKLRDDPRVTPVGRFLRKTSLDELPQLFNVLRGEMSLVGPRPIVEKEVAFYDKFYPFYEQCRPGITGLWQVSGRSDVDYDRRVELDCTYVTTWSVSRDVVILLRTPGKVLRRRGAY
ncbi:glycosyltransferase [Azospirillum sp. RWY-5-1]|uniref:Glycosyltransferase n=1 Tax=Azospirillum oleiclasticum TaxID=2735135 RepID=A0ABX2TLR4_9PROT|nr:sugar transferase [Azospirillum oleiclasticum]NYZ16655.1 glycosyltransferase [Azospirillum oleiclasticum]NYZ24142.1 glycosyltransferase [Azospirillum oleiclasticum]